MKVSFIYRILFFLFVGACMGFGFGAYSATKVLLKNLPPTTEVSIGKVKLRGQGNTIENVIETEDISTEANETKNKKNRVRRRDR